MAQKVYQTMQGKIVELDKLIMKNETVVAVGNVKVNARGDELGPGGQIIRKTAANTMAERDDSVVTQHRVAEKTTQEHAVEEQAVEEVSQEKKIRSTRIQKNEEE